MNNLRIELPNNLPSDYFMLADGKEMALNRVKDGQDYYEINTEKEKVTLNIFNTYEGRFSAVGWFFTTLLYWLLSGFGIFDFISNKSCCRVDYKAEVSLKENTLLKLKLNSFKKDAVAIEVLESNAEDYNETENVFSLDKKAKRRKIIYNLFRIFFIIGAAIALVFILSQRA